MNAKAFVFTAGLGLLLAGGTPAWAQQHSTHTHGDHATHAGNDQPQADEPAHTMQLDDHHADMEHDGMDHSKMDHSGNDQTDMDHSSMDHSDMDMGSMQGGSAPADARDPDYSDGIRFEPVDDAHLHGTKKFGMLLINRLEYFNGRHDDGVTLDAQGWYGGDLDKFWWKLEGEHADATLQDYRAEALWSHAVSAYWNTQLGVRHDGGAGPGRDWAAVGIQGLAPYWFELSATAYVGQGGRTAARLEAEYEILLTQRLILQPKLELNAYGKNDLARGLGSGLSDASFGLRLRYEVRRRFAPYLGIEWAHKYGSTAKQARQMGNSASDRQFVAGIRIWL